MKKLSFIFLIIGLSGCNSSTQNNNQTAPKTEAVYTCSMHPEVKADKPGVCSKCSMELVKKSN
jgi:hypothetical protein